MTKTYQQLEKRRENKHYDFLHEIVNSEQFIPEASAPETSPYHVGTINEPKRAERIVPELVKYIQAHKLIPGSKLPSQREMCDLLGVGANSLREALVTLQTIGLVQSRQGAGWFVGKFDPVGSLKFLAPILEAYTESNAETILETRMAIEPVFARRAAKFISEEGLAKLDQLNHQMVQSGKQQDFETFRESDKMFHITISQESHSGIMCVLGTLLNNLFVSYWTPACIDYESPIHSHDEILAALRAGDSNRAEQCMKEHIETAKEFLLEKIRKCMNTTE